jgi:hypothetical protein
MKTNEKAIEKAKKSGKNQGRKWLGPVVLDPYESESNRVEFYVLEGSPAQGFIISLHDFAIRIVGTTADKVLIYHNEGSAHARLDGTFISD